MQPPPGAWSPPCPVCGRPSADAGPRPCPQCGLPAVGHAALVVARIGVTLADLARDRDALLAQLRAAAPGAAVPVPAAATPVWGAGARTPPPPPPPPSTTGWAPAPPVAPPLPPPPPRRRLSPQQVLLGLGALLVVAAALTFVAVAWTRLGVAFQSLVMLAVTGLLCGASAWTARRGLRATEEALAAAGAALLAVDLAAARWLGLGGLEDVPARLWWAVSCAVLVGAGLLLGRLTRSTATWPLVALLAAQPLPLLLLPGELVSGPAGVAAALAVAAGDVVAARTIRRALAPTAEVLAAIWGTAGALGGLAVAAGDEPLESWLATAVLVAAGAGALASARWVRPGAPREVPAAPAVAGVVGAVVGAALALSLRTAGEQGLLAAAGVGVVLLVAAVLATGPSVLRLTATPALLAAGGAAAVLVPAGVLAAQGREPELALVLLGVALPAALAAVRLPLLRSPATGTALLAPLGAVLLAHAGDVLSAPVAGSLLAVLGAVAFGLATLRSGRPEEWVCAAGGALAGSCAGAVTATVGAWGQVALQLAVVGAAAGCYAVVARRRPVALVAVADLVVATWIAVGGADVGTPEAYTLPAAAGLLLVAVPALRAGARSWAAEGPAVALALVPSALVVVADPTALRLVLVVAAALAATVAGTLLHRQAPFTVGAGVLLVVSVGRLAPYAPLLPRWLSLGTAGLLLLLLGATYERRRVQAREAVAWVAQMR